MTTTVIETELVNVTCLENQIQMTLVSTGSKGISPAARASELTFNQCTVPNGTGGTENCTVKALNLGKEEAQQQIGIFKNGKGGNGQLALTTSSLGEFGFSVECKEKVEKLNCTFTGQTLSTVLGGPILDSAFAKIFGAEQLPPMAGGKKCPTKAATWKFSWIVTEPSTFYMEAE